MAQHSKYWSCSKFADKLRGTPKLKCGTAEEWHDWRVQAKQQHPIRWWLAEEGLDKIQDFIYYPVTKLYDLKYYINNRFITHTHCLTASPKDLPRGQWCDVGNRFLPCLFNELVDFVEVELAWWHLAWNEDERAKYAAPWYAFGWWRIRTWRCPQAGLDSLEWQRNLRWTKEEVGEDSPDLGQPTPQAIAAQEILDLYKWWTETYRNRPDPYDASGWHDHCNNLRKENGDEGLDLFREAKSPELKKQGKDSLDLLRKIEDEYEQEDETMLIRLIKIRNGLWT